MSAPLLDQDAGFTKAVEDFASEQRVSEPAIDASTLSIFPRSLWFDVGCLCTYRGNPNLNCLCRELRAIVMREEGGSERRKTEGLTRVWRSALSSMTVRRGVTAQGPLSREGTLNLRKTLSKVVTQAPPA